MNELKKQALEEERAQEAQLIQKWQETQDSKALSDLFQRHKKLVDYIALGYRGYGLSLDDIKSEAYIGMMHAVKHFDISKGFRFHTYAYWWIKALINDYILSNVSMVKMVKNPYQKKLFFNLNRMKQKYHDKLTPENITKIAQELNVPEEEVVYMNTRLQKDMSLNTVIKADEETEWIDWLADERHLPEFEILQQDELSHRKASVEKAMQTLNEREYDILTKRKIYDPPISLEDLAKKYDISKERVRQIEMGALEKLKKNVRYV